MLVFDSENEDDPEVAVTLAGTWFGDASSLVVDGDTAYSCISGQLATASLTSGLVVAEELHCAGVAPADDGVWLSLTPGAGVSRYLNLKEALAGEAVEQFDVAHASRFSAAGGLLYGAWHSASEVVVYDATTGLLVDTVQLAEFDSWIWGLDVVDDTIWILADGRDDASYFPHLLGFDALTGQRVVDRPLVTDSPGFVRGLWCRGP